MQSGFLEEVYNQTTVDYWKNELIWAPVFQKVDKAILQINYHTVDNAIGFPDTVKRPIKRPPLYNRHFFSSLRTKNPYIASCLNLSTTATFFCPQGGRCREVQLCLFSSKSFFFLNFK